MARDQIDMTPIETRDELVAWFEAGNKPKAQFRAGTEHEKFVFMLDGHRPVPYAGRKSIHAILEGMHGLLGWEPIMDGENIIGLFDVTGGGAIRWSPAASLNCRARRSKPSIRPRRNCSPIWRRCAKWPSRSASASSASA